MLTEEEVADILIQEVHVCLVVGFYAGDVGPVALHLVGIDALQALVADKDIPYEIIAVFCCAALDELDQQTSADHIDTAGIHVGLSHHRLLVELGDASVLVQLHHAEAGHILAGCSVSADDRDVGLLLDVIFQDLVVVQLVNAVARRDDNIGLMAVLQEGQVLVQSVRCTAVPVVGLRGDGGREHVHSALLSSEIPPLGGA